MRIAFDEHVPIILANAFKALDGEERILRAEIVSARDYSVPNSSSDVPWLQRFHADGGRVVISGDARMRGKLHEQKALLDAGFIVIFLERKWNEHDGYTKSAMLIKWWPVILKTIKTAKRGQFFEVPFNWNATELRDVTPPPGLGHTPKVRPDSKN